MSLNSTDRFLSLLVCVSLSVVLTGCGVSAPQVASEAAAADTLVNTVCPIMGGEAQSDVSVDWNGKKVGFCCPPCIEEWAELTEEQKTSKLASAAAKPHGDDHGHSTEPGTEPQSAPVN